MVAGSLQELVNVLCERFPEDAEDLREALEVLLKQRVGSCERLARLGDAQWQRLNLPLGIEALLRDEAAAVLAEAAAEEAEPPAPAAVGHLGGHSTRAAFDDDGSLPLEEFESEGLHRRGGGAQRKKQQPFRGFGSSSSPKGRLPPEEAEVSQLEPPEDLEALWQRLLEDTLPPDKRPVLQDAWISTKNAHDRYMMYLEYTSYLRKPEVTEQEKAERKKQLEPLMREFGLKSSDFEDSPEYTHGILWWIFFGVIFFLSGLIYYAYSQPDPLHDLQAF
mmetsp:Transcript_12097/g.32421  ORF Transcript_12097/g.32421 Transcript_12097/m.32421 type:complete len:277 (-) Transcript_12097:121-951(-)